MELPELARSVGVGPVLGLGGIAAAVLLQLAVGLTLLLPALRWWSGRRCGEAAPAWSEWLDRRGRPLRRRVLIATLLTTHLYGLLLVATFPRLPAALLEALRSRFGSDAAGTLLQLAAWGLLRLAVSVALAGLLLLWTASRSRSEARPDLARVAAWIAAGGFGAAALSAGLAAQTLTPWQLEAVQGELPMATVVAGLGLALAAALALGLGSLLWQGGAWTAVRTQRLASVLLALALVVAGSGELVRESLRRPWLIGGGKVGLLYLNGLTPDEVQRARADGLGSVRPVLGADGAPSGARIFRAACTPCHSPRGLRGAVDGLPPAAIAAWLPRLDRVRGRMPPFPGNAADAAALTLYLAGLDGRLDETLLPPPGPLIAAGRRVMEYRCLGCHRDLPLRKRVAGWSMPFAYEAIGRLPKLNPGMPAFGGTEQERRALAAWLAALGAGLAD